MNSTSQAPASQAGAQIIRLPSACTDPVQQPSLRGRRPKTIGLIWQRREEHQAKVKEITDEIAFHESVIADQQRKISALRTMLNTGLRALAG